MQVSLLSSGRLMFHGACADLLPWFTSLGFVHTRGSASDWVLDLVATGFTKPEHLFGDTMRSKSDVDAAADAFKAHCMKVKQKSFSRSVQPCRTAECWACMQTGLLSYPCLTFTFMVLLSKTQAATGTSDKAALAINSMSDIMGDSKDVTCLLKDQASMSADATISISSHGPREPALDCETGSGHRDVNAGGELSDAAFPCLHSCAAQCLLDRMLEACRMHSVHMQSTTDMAGHCGCTLVMLQRVNIPRGHKPCLLFVTCHTAAAGLQKKPLDHSSGSRSSSYPATWWAQFTALVVREFTAATRNPFDVAARCGFRNQ